MNVDNDKILQHELQRNKTLQSRMVLYHMIQTNVKRSKAKILKEME